MSFRENRKTSRLKLEKHLKVVMGSIGNNIHYDLLTRNISYNGFFLDFEKPGRFPFTPASILEIWLELEDGNTVFFNGKMTRVVFSHEPSAKETGPGIAVRIVQIDSKNESKLKEFIDRRLAEQQKEQPIGSSTKEAPAA